MSFAIKSRAKTVVAIEIDMAIVTVLAIVNIVAIKTIISLSEIEPGIQCKELIQG